MISLKAFKVFLADTVGLNFDIKFRIFRVIFKLQNSKNLLHLTLHIL